jgi:regulator of protease activity HflC (stomatin/prohibitin superfamily)
MKGFAQTFSLGLIFIALFLLYSTVKIVPAGHTGVVFNLSGGVQNKALREGIHFLIPILQTLIIYDTRISTYSFSSDDRYGEVLGESIIAKTRDGQVVGIEISLVSQMIQERAPEIYKARNDYKPILKAKVGKVMQEVVASHVADALYTDSTREAITQEAKKMLSESFVESGFMLHDFYLRKIDFSQEYIAAIERKQIALQKAQLAQIRKEIAIKEKEIEIIRGEANAKEVEIKGQAIQVNPLVAELEYLEEIERSSSNIPVIVGLRGNSFINLDSLLSGSRTP